ncbi:arylesterase [Segetibacter sp.]|jgi:acyl-CoA thioesterase-1|uniref:arylesterase n=1 Tax=Segetibacter sp. TaxID=2231182 RepID=UPI002629D7E9|nr:arylesterase [Segetibacter sp.]MCW3080644.1 family lipase [Segetibacter sp.]
MFYSLNKGFVFGALFLFLIGVLSCSEGAKNETSGSGELAKEKTDAVNQPVRTILFFGNSLTAGYGLDPTESFPSVIQQKIDSAKLPFKSVNAGVSGETSAGGNGRIDWILKQPVDVFVLELGANDGLRGIPVAETKRNLQAIIDKVRKKYPNAQLVLAGMQMPPSMGQEYGLQFRSIFPELAKKNDMALVPFLLERVGGVRELNQPDGIHPSSTGAKILAENVWIVLEPVLRKMINI